MAIPQVASGVRRGLRPISGRIAAGISPAASAEPELRKDLASGKSEEGDRERRRCEQRRQRELPEDGPFLLPPAEQRADRKQDAEQDRERPGDRVEIGRADRNLLAADRFRHERIERPDEDDARG